MKIGPFNIIDVFIKACFKAIGGKESFSHLSMKKELL